MTKNSIIYIIYTQKCITSFNFISLLSIYTFFLGDTLFLGGCGRFFEGNATQMYDALIKTLSQLPDSTVRKQTYVNI